MFRRQSSSLWNWNVFPKNSLFYRKVLSQINFCDWNSAELFLISRPLKTSQSNSRRICAPAILCHKNYFDFWPFEKCSDFSSKCFIFKVITFIPALKISQKLGNWTYFHSFCHLKRRIRGNHMIDNSVCHPTSWSFAQYGDLTEILAFYGTWYFSNAQPWRFFCNALNQKRRLFSCILFRLYDPMVKRNRYIYFRQ